MYNYEINKSWLFKINFCTVLYYLLLGTKTMSSDEEYKIDGFPLPKVRNLIC